MTAPSASQTALDRLDRANRRVKLLVFVAASVESILLLAVLLVIDFKDPLHRLLFLLSMLTYFTLALAIVALGAHVTRVQERLTTAIELLRGSSLPR